MASSPDFDIVVVGAGLVGLAFACSMKDSGYRILIVEAGNPPMYDGSQFDVRVNSINLSSEGYLDALGVWSLASEKRVTPFHSIKVWDSIGGGIEFHADEIGEQYLGHIVESNVLTTSLMERIDGAENIEKMFDAQLEFVQAESNHVCVKIHNREPLTSCLVVGADGGNSMVRKMAGIACIEEPYNQRAIVAQIEVSEPIPGTAFQRFLPTGPLALLPLTDDSYSIVWSCSFDRVEELEKCEAREFEEQLERCLDYRFGEVRLMSGRVAFNLRKLQVTSYFSGRTVLLGDAAHVIHPLAGMGANLGLMDAAALYDVLSSSSSPEDDPWNYSSMRKYERWRKSANIPVINLMDGFDKGFRTSSQAMRMMLGLGLTFTNRLNIAKRKIIRLACGISGDIPNIAKRS